MTEDPLADPKWRRTARGLQVTTELVYEVEGGTRPVCTAQPVFRYYA